MTASVTQMIPVVGTEPVSSWREAESGLLLKNVPIRGTKTGSSTVHGFHATIFQKGHHYSSYGLGPSAELQTRPVRSIKDSVECTTSRYRRKSTQKATKTGKLTPNDRLRVPPASFQGLQQPGSSTADPEARPDCLYTSRPNRSRRHSLISVDALKKLLPPCQRARCLEGPAASPNGKRAAQSHSRPRCSLGPSAPSPPSAKQSPPSSRTWRSA